MAIRDVDKEAVTREKKSTSRKGARGGDSPPVSSSPPRSKRDPRSSSHGKRDPLAQVETKLTELLSGVAMMQSTAGAVTGDERHIYGAEVTANFAPKLASAWVKLARTNPAIAKILIKMSEGSEVGEVAALTAMFAVTQAQIYGALPDFPNPYKPDMPVPPSRDVRDHERAVQNGQTPPPPHVANNLDAVAQAEADRAAAEETRKKRPSAPPVE